MNNNPTMRDIALLAKVSTATVSRVFSFAHEVSPKTKKRVEDAARQLGYYQHKPRYDKTSQRQSRSLLVLHKKTLDQHQLFASLEEEANTFGYQLIFMQLTRSKYKYILSLLNTLMLQLDGIIIISPSDEIHFLETHYTQLPPLVLLDHFSAKYACVYFDHLSISFNAFNYLKSQGHQNIACILDKNNPYESEFLLQGYYQSLMRENISIREENIINTTNSIQSGINALCHFMALPVQPTAIFCHSENLVQGAFYQAQKMSINIPNLLSFIHLTHSTRGKYTSLHSTSIYKPFDKMGKIAFSLLLAQINNPKKPKEFIMM